ncbi:hypothetical protein TL16_g05591 [Triparma laevis f. inornata]|uniref:Uncharacterized protein n=1 Tax=Triparma laevis f. inornata TaxID=1714386 RepID=A0A9W7AII4_9STRA|nr:hypothetical protein TL16_g05591 [Triparma laevis f. inornata]
MTPSQKATTLAMMFELQSMYFCDDEPAKFEDVKYWTEEVAGGYLHITDDTITDDTKSEPDPDSPKPPDSPDSPDSPLMSAIEIDGYHISPPPPSTPDSLSFAINHTLASLASHGWPPQFLLLYDEIWTLLSSTISSHYTSLGPSLLLEADVNVWHLTRPPPSTSPSPPKKIGSNFPNPHRDMTYSQCHPTSSLPTSLSIWIPLTPSGSTPTNGCMRILPISQDNFFFSPDHPHHSNNSHYVDGGEEVKLTVPQFGSASWDPSCVHWGGGCEFDSKDEPRASLAFTIRKGDAKKGEFIVGGGEGVEQTGPKEVEVGRCGEGGIRRRLSVVAKAILGYSHHWPGLPFEEFEENLLRTKEKESAPPIPSTPPSTKPPPPPPNK